jgi:hypothetical protein
MGNRHITKAILIILAIGLPLATMIFFWRFLASPSKGTVSRGTISDPIKPANSTGTVLLDGKLFSFQRQKAYVPRPLPKADPDSLEQHYFLTGLPYSKTLVVTVEKLSLEGLEAQSGYHLRKTLADEYREAIRTTAEHSARVMVKRDKLEQTAFITKGMSVIFIGITTTSAEDNLDAEMSQILGSFKWK